MFSYTKHMYRLSQKKLFTTVKIALAIILFALLCVVHCLLKYSA